MAIELELCPDMSRLKEPSDSTRRTNACIVVASQCRPFQRLKSCQSALSQHCPAQFYHAIKRLPALIRLLQLEDARQPKPVILSTAGGFLTRSGLKKEWNHQVSKMSFRKHHTVTLSCLSMFGMTTPPWFPALIFLKRTQ